MATLPLVIYHKKIIQLSKKMKIFKCFVVVVQPLSHAWLFATPWTAAHRLPCPPVSPGVCSSSCPLSW